MQRRRARIDTAPAVTTEGSERGHSCPLWASGVHRSTGVVRQRAKRTRMSALREQRPDAIGVGGEVNEPIGSQRKEWAGAEPRRRDERQP